MLIKLYGRYNIWWKLCYGGKLWYKTYAIVMRWMKQSPSEQVHDTKHSYDNPFSVELLHVNTVRATSAEVAHSRLKPPRC